MTEPTRRLVVALHGTRLPEGQAACVALVDAVAARLPGVDVRVGWADVLTPTLTDTLRAVGECVVVPGFLTTGYHVSYDVPKAIRDAGGRAVLTPHVGEGILGAVAERLAETGVEADAVVLAAAGSKRPEPAVEVRAAAAKLSALLGVSVTAGFVTAAEPSVREAVAQAREAGARRVAIASYFLNPGLLPARLEQADADAVARPIGLHPQLVDAIVQRFLAVQRHVA